jgi:glucosamine-6-phosphate deaminase
MEELAIDKPLLQMFVSRLDVRVFSDRAAMGAAAGHAVAERVRRQQAQRPTVSVVFAAAPSQDEMLATLARASGIDWSSVVALQMDEYAGVPPSAPQSFGRYLDESLFARVHPGEVHVIDGTADPGVEGARYGALLEDGVDVCCMGIGENGHIAFNEPGEADFEDPRAVRLVELDEVSRAQQVRDGCFTTLDEVPRSAFTLTVPALMRANQVVCTVPGSVKRDAVARTLWGPMGPQCPASALRAHPDAVLFLDRDSWPGDVP